MPTLRKMIDEGVLLAASPLATHVAKHLQDPVGSTKDDFETLQQKKMEYDQAKEATRRNLAPVQSVLDHVNQLHQLDGVMPPDPMVDPNANPDMEQAGPAMNGVPANMAQQPGRLGQTKPTQAWQQPGAAPKTAQQGKPIPGGRPGQAGTAAQTQVRPPKLGVPKPGQGNAGTRAGNPSKKSATATAKKNGGGHSIKLEVNSSARRRVRPHSIESGAALASLRFQSDVGENELRNKLQEALRDKVGESRNSSPCQSGPTAWIEEVYPFKKYFVYSEDKGTKFRQDYKMAGGAIELVGEPKRVKIAYVAASKRR